MLIETEYIHKYVRLIKVDNFDIRHICRIYIRQFNKLDVTTWYRHREYRNPAIIPLLKSDVPKY